MKKTEAALTQYNLAIHLNPSALQARVKKAHILLKLGDAEQALAEYLVVKDAQPADANVHLHIGQAYKRLRNKREAIRYFTICMTLDPVAQRFVREEMEGWDEEVGEAGWSSDEG